MNNKPKGYLCLVLHAHLPFVRHPEREYQLEENWLFEAITETYIPLLVILKNLSADRVPLRITMSLTPTLCTMLADPLLQSRYVKHISKLILLAEKELVRTKSQPMFHQVASMYLEKFLLCRSVFTDSYQCNILTGFADLQNKGVLEIITCGATHGFLPTMQYNPPAVKAQIEVAVDSYESFFNRKPRGIWLPECGYFPGLEKKLSDSGIRYFFLDTHGIIFAEPRPKYGVYSPIYCPETTVAAFGRDTESSQAVWSSKVGYPGDFHYRDFYRDIGFDLPMDYILPYIDPIGLRIQTGIKYHRITGLTDQKEPYQPSHALQRAMIHAGNFLFNRQQQANYLSDTMDKPPVIVAPYDAELFGHWWYEGPFFLNFLVRKIAFEQDTIALITPGEYLDLFPSNQVCAPTMSSWGQNGYNQVWLEGSNDWIYRHLHMLETIMTQEAIRYSQPDQHTRRILNQMARELLLAESSDWAFMMKNGSMTEYAVSRTKEHISNFLRLSEGLHGNAIDEHSLALLENRNNIFPNINYSVYA